MSISSSVIRSTSAPFGPITTPTARASFAFYNTHEEVERLAASLAKVQKFFS
jgi:selenocysteine lyase/cysteine desulfurase